MEDDRMAEISVPFPSLHLVEDPRPCSYLPTETARLEYRMDQGLNADELQQLIIRGWRRFGIQIFRPACEACSQCVPIRIDVNNFQPSKSQRKIRNRNSHVRMEWGIAGYSEEHLQLHNDWHESMSKLRDWPENQSDASQYFMSFLSGKFPSAHEIRYYDQDRLIGVSMIDVLPTAISSIYFYHAPDWRPAGPGTFSLMVEIELARSLQLQHVYLGYWIADCPSMTYKNRFHPHEVLMSRPELDEKPLWKSPNFLA